MRAAATSPGVGLIDALAAALGGGAVPGIVSAYLFGSEAEERAHRDSDLDVGVLLRHDEQPTAGERFEARLRLVAALGAAVGREVDVVILNDAPPLFARRIALSGRRIFCADAGRDHAFVRDVQLRAADVEPFVRRTRRVKLDALRR
jgi:predicted nucleotidyltransferase